VAPLHLNVRGSFRWNSAFAFLDPVRGRSNLTILADTLIDRLLVRGGSAGAVSGTTAAGPVELRARTFVLCAGAAGSPAILLRSGVGPGEHLRALGIPVEVDLPGVGQNMAEHPGAVVAFELTPAARGALEDDIAGARRIQAQVMLRGRSPHGDE